MSFFNLLKHIQKKYSDKRSFFKTLRGNLLLTIAVVASLYLLENTAVIKGVKDIALDNLMFWYSDFEPTLADGQNMQRMAIALGSRR